MQLLQIGCYYITKHDREDSFCNLKGSDYFIGKKILIPSTTHMWTLSFGTDEVCQNNSTSKCIPLDDSFRSDELLSGYHKEVLLQTSNRNLSETSSDMSLCLSANVLGLGELHLKELKESLIKPVVTPKDIPNISSCISPVMTVPPLSTASNMFPEGNLISVCGHVVAVHSIEDNSVDPYLNRQNLRDPLELRFSPRATSSCIHVLVDHQIVILISVFFFLVACLTDANRYILIS